MSPRSILKARQQRDHRIQPPPSLFEPFPFAACTTFMLTPHVHFPPTPALVSTHSTHSPTSYDRTSIVVAPNSCALPDRHDRVYAPSPESLLQTEVKGSYFHPRAFEACEPEPSEYIPSHLRPPPLIPDTSSESDESDGPIT
ncbi:hypothetical protein SERLADRAFT_377105, partial [Serpula lacrymans var. lacrymans S7.9]